jgi:putative transposase
LKLGRGLPRAIRCGNGLEPLGKVFVRWCEESGIEIRYIQPGKPNKNAFVEHFNRTYREEVLDAYLFWSLEEVREITYEWMECYNEQRPDDALGGLPPEVYREIRPGSVTILSVLLFRKLTNSPVLTENPRNCCPCDQPYQGLS